MPLTSGPAAQPSAARVMSLNVGQPRAIQLRDRTVLTSIFKSPVQDRRSVVGHNIDGDRQSDLTVHGGPYKAVYCYPSEHYPYWREQLPDAELPYGIFGENLTTEGLLEGTVYIGDRFRVGSAILQVTQPRMPCYKLGLRFNRADIVKRFWLSGRPGIYFSVVEEGSVAVGDPIQLVTTAAPDGITVENVVRLYRGQESDPELLARALRAPLYGSWKQELREREGTATLPFGD
jgi:MOSC domain-containing protein YiiM